MSRVGDAFCAVVRKATEVFPWIVSTKLQLCRMADRDHEKKWRQFAHANHLAGTVCFARAAEEELTDEELVGMTAHEIGHLVSLELRLPAHMEEERLGVSGATPQAVQDEADQVARQFGILIRYNKRTLQEAVCPNAPRKLVLLHGTTEIQASRMFREGIRQKAGWVYLTDDPDLANLFARQYTCPGETQGRMVVLEVTVPDPSRLEPDLNIYEFPPEKLTEKYGVGYDDTLWDAVEDGRLKAPRDDSDWETSLKYVNSVRYVGWIPPENIKVAWTKRCPPPGRITLGLG